MRRSDDEMKIDISELFGGELDDVSKSHDSAHSAKAIPVSSPEAQTEKETKFQEWMVNREKELELKSQELERRLQEIHVQQNLEKFSPSLDLSTEMILEKEAAPSQEPEAVIVLETENESNQEVVVVSDLVPIVESANEISPIDFNAPIAPPFMGVSGTPQVFSEEAISSQVNSTADSQPGDPGKEADLKRLQADHEFLMLYDEFRNIIAHELKDLVGEKKTYTMLGRTFELARGKYPEIFRNANWDAAGNLLEDGSVDSQRVIENKNILDVKKSDIVLDTALSALLNLRLQAVEKGLGTGLKNKVRAHLYQWITEKIQRAGRDGKDPSILRRLNGYVAQV